LNLGHFIDGPLLTRPDADSDVRYYDQEDRTAPLPLTTGFTSHSKVAFAAILWLAD
jgi:hypothetical protein